MKCNLGCGQFPKAGYVNVDIDSRAKADIFHDLSQLPYPFEAESFSLIEMHHVLEHLPNTILVMGELHRLLKPGGALVISVPHFSRGFMHWDHKIGFDITFPLYFNSSFQGGYTGIDFQEVSTRLTWLAQKALKKQHLSPFQFASANFLGYVFDFIGNLNIYATSRLFCFYVGGYEEIRFEFKKNASSQQVSARRNPS
jgi:SAM-dependent methyltransferase